MQDGSWAWNPVTGSRHRATLLLSQPHPSWLLSGAPKSSGLFPANPSRVAATSSMCAPNDGSGEELNVRSEMANALASAIRGGVPNLGWHCEKQGRAPQLLN